MDKMATEAPVVGEPGEPAIQQVFIGYASEPPLLADSLLTAGGLISSTGLVRIIDWQHLKVGGRVVLSRITQAIDESVLGIFDLTALNPNVLFELGYAIGSRKSVWVLLDTSDESAVKRWKQFQLLTPVGYVDWTSAEDVRAQFVSEMPHVAESTLFDDLLEPQLEPAVPRSVFYVPSYHATSARRETDRLLGNEKRRGLSVSTADPTESSLNPLTWYSAKVYATTASLILFEADRRELAWLRNARAALAAGLAHGMRRPVLMLAEEDYSAPFDYQHLLKAYSTAREAALNVEDWIRNLPDEHVPARRSPARRLATELRNLRLGEHVAENESESLPEYFIETAAFDDVIANRNSVFVGRKGSGKTANMLEAASELGSDARNLVVVIKPPAYEFTALIRLVTRLPLEVRQYSIQALWQFLLSSQIANRTIELIQARPAHIPLSDGERALMEFADSSSFGLLDDFATRFEFTIQSLSASELVRAGSVAEGRDILNELLHQEAIRRLRALLGPVLRGKERVAVLIDNLDKAWERTTDLDTLSHLLLGLFAATGRLSTDFEKEDYWRDRIRLTLATFLRADIWSYVRGLAREPDKVPVSRVEWTDGNLLIRVLEERFLAVRPEGTAANELWDRFICPTVRDRNTKDYLLARCLPRPRDLVYFANAAISSAVNARHNRVEEEDVLAGERAYSQFAFEALLVENGITIRQLDDVLLELAGEPEIIGASRLKELIERVDLGESTSEYVRDRLIGLSVLGIEVREGEFEFLEVEPEDKRGTVLARKLAEQRGGDQRFCINPAYRAYLEIAE